MLNGLEDEDPPEVSTAQETPIFGPTHHLTNTRVKISMMATIRMRRKSFSVKNIVFYNFVNMCRF